MDNYVGKRLDGRYEIQEIIGVGGMSVVYKAYDNVDDRIVAVKILKDEFLTNDDFVRRFKNESKAIALLSHPNIVKVYDVSFGEKLQYIVMEYVDGITLKEYIQKQGAITWNDALFFMTQILKALQHAHDKGIVHRDIKPQNIILLSNGNIKVADFGIARFSRSETRTLTDTAIGSVHYISPEQAKGELTDERADIYSVGVVLYEMLSGRVPFEADSAVSVALKQLQEDAKKLTDINPDIPLGLEQVCIHAMQKNPENRYQTATEMLLDVEEVIKNPNTVFDYSYFIDKEPTKYVINSEEIQPQPDELEEEEFVDEFYYRQHKRKVITAVTIGIVVLVAAIVLLVLSITGTSLKSTHTLESFVGMSYDELKSSNQYNYEFIMEEEKNETEKPGTIIAQSPEAGSKVLDGSMVTLFIAVSGDDIKVPNIYNLDTEKAKKALGNEGLYNFRITTVASDTVSQNNVVYTNPKAGSIVSADTQIVIYVSSGPTTEEIKKLQMPDVVGLNQEGARAFLEKVGFTNINFETKDSEKPKGVVIAQNPSTASYANADDKIIITISSGVTTTTTKKDSKVALSVALPKCIDGNGNYTEDILVIELDGEVYLSQNVQLKGNKVNVSISTDGDKDVQVKVSLKNSEALETRIITSGVTKDLSVSFVTFSYDESLTNTTEASTQPQTNDNGSNDTNA